MKKILLASFLVFFSLSTKADFSTAEKAFNDNHFREAFNEFLPLSETGDCRVQYYLGFMYLYGLGVTKDNKKALEYIQKSADQEYDKAQALLGFLYDEGRIIPKDKEKAISYYKKAVNKGNTNALLNLGLAYYKGEGVEKNEEKAIKLLLQVPTDREHPYVGRYLGEVYMNSDLPDKFQNAEKEFKKSAVMDDIESFYLLGQLYETNNNLEKAIKFYKYSASKGYMLASYHLGKMYIDKGDLISGCAWWEIAASHDYEPAKSALLEQKNKMTKEQIQKAEEEFSRLTNELKYVIESPFVISESHYHHNHYQHSTPIRRPRR